MKFIGIDIGGTWIKGTVVNKNFLLGKEYEDFFITKILSPLHSNATIEELIKVLQDLISGFNLNENEIEIIGISTAGIINYHGTKVTKVAEHLNVLKTDRWKEELEKKFRCKIIIINDADAASIGLAELGYLKGNKTIGVMPIGTGLGFSVWRNGRRWRPGKSFTLLGSIRLPKGSYDSLVSASKLAANDENENLVQVLTDKVYLVERKKYLQALVEIINSAAILYSLDEVIICGGLASAAIECGYSLEKQLNLLLKNFPPELNNPVKVTVAKEGNKLQLLGVLALAKGEAVASTNRVEAQYLALHTEIPYDRNLHLEKMKTSEIIEAFWKAEQDAGQFLNDSLSIISEVVDNAIKRIKNEGRIIYIGAGTSGRVAAMDAVEVPCTYGFPKEKILTLIPGGIADAAIEIEADFEEDASAVPEMLLLNIKPNDVIIGISASGSAYYVQSALAFAKSKEALTIQIQVNKPQNNPTFCDFIIPLNSGNEVVAGSTRMKAGTATKKVLNFLSSAIMIKLGKVVGPYMIDVACINNKLVDRAINILNILYGINKEEAYQRLKETNMDLGKAILKINNN